MFVQQIESLYVFAVWMLGDRQAAFEAMRSVLDKPLTERLPALVALLAGNKRPPGGINRFDELDGILRTNTTVRRLHQPPGGHHQKSDQGFTKLIPAVSQNR